MNNTLTFKEARARRMLDTPAWWLQLQPGGADNPVSGDQLAYLTNNDHMRGTSSRRLAARIERREWWNSFSKSPHSPRFPTPLFARVQQESIYQEDKK